MTMISSHDLAHALEDGLASPRGHQEHRLPSGICILIEDAMNQRLVESASLQIEAGTFVLDPRSAAFAALDSPATLETGGALETGGTLETDGTLEVLDTLARAELIVADQTAAERLRLLFQRRPQGDSVNPGIVVVTSRAPETAAAASDPRSAAPATGQLYDGVLTMPQPPALLAAQLSLLLYAHRAFARRYQDTLEELNLNRRIFRSVTSGISVASALMPDVPLTYVNPAFEAMTGYCLEEVLGKNCRFLQGSETSQAAVTLIRDAIAAGRELTVVLKNFRKNGSPFWNELSLSPIRNRDGGVTHFVGIQNDVTARVEFEDALRESEKLAAVGRLASSIAHEINNPLESVMNLIYLAKHSDDPAHTQTYLSTADSELQRVKLITSQSLRFFKQSTKPQAVACADLLDSVLSLYQSRLANGGVSVDRRDRSTPPVVCMESEIRQVLNNLVSNAIDAMRGTGGRLLIRTRRSTRHNAGPGASQAGASQAGASQERSSEANGTKPHGSEPPSTEPRETEGILITVADTGHGIDPETIKSIYKAFYTTKGIGGTGLGLWISSEIVNRHQGRMSVRSRSSGPRTGTVFTLFLPCQAAA